MGRISFPVWHHQIWNLEVCVSGMWYLFFVFNSHNSVWNGTIDLWMAHKPSYTHFWHNSTPSCRSQGMPDSHSWAPVPNASSIRSQQALHNQLTFIFLLLFLKGSLWNVFITQNHLCTAELLPERILLVFFSFFSPWKIFDVYIFLLETAPRLVKVKGSVLFGMLCNLEFSEKMVCIKKGRKKTKIVKGGWKSSCEYLQGWAPNTMRKASNGFWESHQFLGFATISGYSPNTAGKNRDLPQWTRLKMKRQQWGWRWQSPEDWLT